MAIFFIAFAVLLYFGFRKEVWSLFDHSEFYHNVQLQPDAKIVDVKSEKVQYTKGSAKFKTTVFFSDGFSFITHTTDRDEGFFTYRISIGTELYEEIIRKAIEAHNRALEEQKKF